MSAPAHTRRTRRRAGGAVLAAAALVLSACSSSGSDGGGGSSGDGVTLTFWEGAGLLAMEDGKVDKDRSFLYKAADQFEEANPGVTIKITPAPTDISQANNQFRAASIAKNGPDLRSAFAGGPTLSFSQFLEPLDAWFPAEAQAKLKGWETVREDFSAQGKVVGLPYGAGSYFYVFYNKAKLAEAGEDMAAPPKTWEEMIALAERLKAKGHTPFYVANQEGYLGAWAVAALAGGQAGPSIFLDQYAGEQKIDSPAMRQAYAAYAQLYAKGLTNKDAGQVSNAQGGEGFFAGKGDMYINGGWSNADMVTALGDDVGFFPIPTLASAKAPGVIAGGPNIAISMTKYSKHKEEAGRFLQFLAQPQVIDQYVQLGQTEGSNSVDADPAVITNPLLKAQAEQLKTAQTVYPFDNVMPQEVIDLFYRLNASVFLGTTTPEDATRQLQEAFDKAKK